VLYPEIYGDTVLLVSKFTRFSVMQSAPMVGAEGLKILAFYAFMCLHCWKMHFPGDYILIIIVIS